MCWWFWQPIFLVFQHIFPLRHKFLNAKEGFPQFFIDTMAKDPQKEQFCRGFVFSNPYNDKRQVLALTASCDKRITRVRCLGKKAHSQLRTDS